MKINKMKKTLLAGLGYALPVLAFAQNITDGKITTSGNTTNNINDLIDKIDKVIAPIGPILISLMVIWLIVSVVKFVMAKDDEPRKKARTSILYSILGLAIVGSVFGIVAFVQGTVGVSGGGSITAPKIQID